jgi:anti-anti-sigma factor
MQLNTREGGGHVVARLSGELDAVDAADGAAAITAIMTPGQCLIVDMTALGFIDCCALRALLAVQKLARQEGGDLLLAAPGGSALRLLALTGWDGMISVHASVAAAAASISGSMARTSELKQGRSPVVTN